MRYLDHLVYAVPRLDEYVEIFAGLTGITPIFGGQHPNAGTKNYLVALDDGTENKCYLELIGLDPDQSDVDPRKTMFGLGNLGNDFRPHLATWAIHPPQIDRVAGRAWALGFDFALPTDASRMTPDGQLLRWRYAVHEPLPFSGLQPFLIDWGETPHPSESLQWQRALKLSSIQAEHPKSARLATVFEYLGLDIPVTSALSPALCVRVESPRGSFLLR